MRTRVRELLAARPARWLIAVTLALAMTLAAANLTEAAGPLIEASGTFTQVSFETSNERTVGEITLFDFTEHDTLTGTFTGTSVLEGSCVQRASGQAVCHAVEAFTETVAGRSGSVLSQDVAFSNATTATIQGHSVIVSGTGDLANLHGHGTFEGQGGSGTYDVLLIFAP